MMAQHTGRRAPIAPPPPLFYTVGQVRRAIGMDWSARRVRRWLDRAGALERRFGTVVTTAERLAVAFPEVYRRLIELEDDDELGDGLDDDEGDD